MKKAPGFRERLQALYFGNRRAWALPGFALYGLIVFDVLSPSAGFLLYPADRRRAHWWAGPLSTSVIAFVLILDFSARLYAEGRLGVGGTCSALLPRRPTWS